jgi:hypothetical protein
MPPPRASRARGLLYRHRASLFDAPRRFSNCRAGRHPVGRGPAAVANRPVAVSWLETANRPLLRLDGP